MNSKAPIKALLVDSKSSYLSLSALGLFIAAVSLISVPVSANENKGFSEFHDLYISSPAIATFSDSGLFNENIINQEGYSNSTIIYQTGDANRAVVSQLGSRNEALGVQVGFNNDLTITQGGNDHYAAIYQLGSNHTYAIEQNGTPKQSKVIQVGFGARSEIYQTNSFSNSPLSVHQNSTGAAAVRIIQ